MKNIRDKIIYLAFYGFENATCTNINDKKIIFLETTIHKRLRSTTKLNWMPELEYN